MQERKMIEVATTRRIACAYSQAHTERAMAFKRLLNVLTFLPALLKHVPLGRQALTAPSR